MTISRGRTDSDSPSTSTPADPAGYRPRADPTFFNTVLQSTAPQQQVVGDPLRLDNGAGSYGQDFAGGPFDMLGFIGEITSELQRKHTDLTIGMSGDAGTTSPSTMLNGVDGLALNNERQMDFGSGTPPMGLDATSIAHGGRVKSETPSCSGWSETKETYEEQLLVHFQSVEPPPTIFAPVNLEWKYVRPAILAQSRDFSPLLNAIYCFSDIHKSIAEQKPWNLAPTYHRIASAEVQSCTLGEMSDDTLKKVYSTLFLLMLSEVCIHPWYTR